MHKAAEYNNAEMIKLLVDNGADKRKKISKGDNAGKLAFDLTDDEKIKEMPR